jgi:hypothetical protein
MRSFEYITRLYFERKVLYAKEFFSICDSISMAKLTAMELFGVLSPEFDKIQAELELARKSLDDAEAIMHATFKYISEKFKENDK